jgi:prepilin-type N-terminal cleavage/methylation domain-containing protein
MRLARPQMRAFTIVELLAVIMIMAILMAVAMKALKVDPTQAACSQIAAQLRMARDHAIAKRMYVEVAVYKTLDASTGQLFNAMSTYQSGGMADANNLSPNPTPSAAISYIPSSAWVVSPPSTGFRIIFKPNGSISYGNQYYKKTSVVSISTRAEIEAIMDAGNTSEVAIGATGVDGSKSLYLNSFTGKASFWK